MKIKIISVTDKGYTLANKIIESIPTHDFELRNQEETIDDAFSSAFSEGTAVIFIGAVGIAVRKIATLAKDKLTDPPIIVIDELGINVIPILSGHYGGANELAVEIAKAIEGNPVITTATDINNAFSVDVFARENNLSIYNRNGIKKVSAKALEGKPITLSIKNYPPKETVDVLIEDLEKSFDGTDKAALRLVKFIDKGLVLGVGCKKGKSLEEIKCLAVACLAEIGRDISEVKAISTIDIKEDEEGIIALSRELSVPLLTFDKGLLAKAGRNAGETFTPSEFVRGITGIDNVCERAAILATGNEGSLLLKKHAQNGVTIAIASADSERDAVTHDDKTEDKIYVVGLGPGTDQMLTPEANEVLKNVDVIIGYTVYLDLIRDRYPGKEMLSTPMKREIDRCKMCFDEAAKGKSVAMISSGDAGVYGMASVMLELAGEGGPEIVIIPGITAAVSGAAVLGAPINHDFCVISLSDLLTPWALIERRLIAARDGDFAISIYNPSSKKRRDYLKRACDILLSSEDPKCPGIEPDRPCGIVRNIGRDGETHEICTLGELREKEVDMFTTVFIGNSEARVINGRLVIPRGYNINNRDK